jgi:ADP-ribose pyrophosphatase
MSYRLVDKQVIYDGTKVRLEVHHLENDQTGRRHRREVCVHPGAVVILPFLDAETILLIRTRRYAVDEVLTELPAGTLERNEDPINCAGRELIEETGHLAGRLKPLGRIYPSPGILSERMYLFAAYDLEPTRAAPEEGEEIEVVPTKLADAVEQIRSGDIVDGKTIATILQYVQFHQGRA